VVFCRVRSYKHWIGFLGDGKPYLLPTAFLVVALGILSIFVRQRILVVSAFAIATVTAVVNIMTGLPVLTDEEAIILYASQLFLEGKNPYLYSMAEAFSVYHVPFNVVTGTTSSSFLPSVYIYPPLSFISVAFFHNLETVDVISAVLTFAYSFLKKRENLFLGSFFLFPALSYDFATGQVLFTQFGLLLNISTSNLSRLFFHFFWFHKYEIKIRRDSSFVLPPKSLLNATHYICVRV